MVLGIALIVVGLFATIAGLAIVVLLGPDGSVALAPTRFLSTGVALTLPQLDVPPLPGSTAVVVDVAIEPSEMPVFVGIGRSDDVDAYLRGAPIDVIQQIDWPGAARTEAVPGNATPPPPADEPFWAIARTATDPTVHWIAEPGDWTLVIMRADAQPSVDVTLSGAVTIAALGPLGIGVLAIALGVLAAGVWLTWRTAASGVS
jgi:hypothetical protein